MKYISILILSFTLCMCTSKPSDDLQPLELLYRILEQNAEENTTEISSFLFLTPYSVGVISGTDISVNVPYGTDVTALVASFSYVGSSLVANGTEQTSGETANDFTNAVTYTLTGVDGATIDYTITVTVGSQ